MATFDTEYLKIFVMVTKNYLYKNTTLEAPKLAEKLVRAALNVQADKSWYNHYMYLQSVLTFKAPAKLHLKMELA